MKFTSFSNKNITNYISQREGETKLGEKISTETNKNTQFIILGISEDIGPQANLGNSGAKNAFDAFLGKFLNIQSNRFLSGENICILGEIKVDTQEQDLRSQVEKLDDLIINTLNNETSSDAQLIIIGGGHNNAYPIIRHFAQKNEKLNILNIDPHADTRALEGRHSGNPFSTAIAEDLVESYSAIGLHEQYNSEFIYNFLEENNCAFTFFENYLDGERDLMEDIIAFKEKYKDQNIGFEIDLDAIAWMPTSAYSPSGFNIEMIRSAIRLLSDKNIKYLHLPEGAPKNDKQKTVVGKTLAYFASDFVKSCQ